MAFTSEMICPDQLFSTAEDFINFFLWDEIFRTKSKFHPNQTGKAGMIFRGQSDADWPLLPSVFRDTPLNEFTPQAPYDLNMTDDRHAYMGHHLHAETRAVFIFMEAADSMGLSTPIDYTTTRDMQDLMQAAVNGDKEFDYSEPFPAASFQRSTALAQHHGVPTRYLDWSESPLVAAYFAALNVSVFGKSRPRDGQELIVYFMSTFELSLGNCPVELIRAPRHESSFLQCQHGIFTNHRKANQIFLDTGAWPALNAANSNSCPLIYRARLAATESDELLRRLFDLGITRQSLMPSLDNAAASYSYAKALFDK
jgi:hypothetical protein